MENDTDTHEGATHQKCPVTAHVASGWPGRPFSHSIIRHVAGGRLRNTCCQMAAIEQQPSTTLVLSIYGEPEATPEVHTMICRVECSRPGISLAPSQITLTLMHRGKMAGLPEPRPRSPSQSSSEGRYSASRHKTQSRRADEAVQGGQAHTLQSRTRSGD